MLHKETVWATPNGDMVRLGTLTSNSPMLDEIGPTEKPIRPTELPGPINTLVSAHGSGQPTITTTQHSALFRPKIIPTLINHLSVIGVPPPNKVFSKKQFM